MDATASALAASDETGLPSPPVTSAGSRMPAAGMLSVADLPRDVIATVSALRAPNADTDPALIQRLIEIGFVPGEKLRVIAFGHPGREPIAVRIGSATFALRRFEAQCILVAAE